MFRLTKRFWIIQLFGLLILFLFAYRPFAEEGVNVLLGFVLLAAMEYWQWRKR
jgi:hypothetical protein